MTDPLRPTAPVVELIDCAIELPTPGQRVMALQHGGSLVPTIWTSHAAKDFDAWMRYPKVPQSVKDRQMARYSTQADT